MKIISLDLNTAVLRGEKQDALKCIKECFGVLEAANTMVLSLKPWDGTSEDSAESYAAKQLINAEELLARLSTPAIDMYHDGGLSKTPVLYERLEVFQAARDQLYDILDDIITAYVDLTEEEIIAVSELSIKVLEQLSFFVFFEFNFDVTAYSIQQSMELEVNEIVLEYTGKEGLDLDKKILFLLDLYRLYRPTIPSFDFTEEEIDMFYYHTGVLTMSVLDNIDAIDPEVVKKLAYGEISPEEVISNLFPDREVNKLDLFQ